MGSLFSELSDLVSSRSETIFFLASLSLFTFAGTLILLPLLLIRIPEDYFLASYRDRQHDRRLRIVFHIFKNVLALIFLLMGFLMLFIPGQGILTILAALWLMDLPGKRRIEKRLIHNRSVYRAIDIIRKKAGKQSLRLEEQETHSPGDFSD